jgi:hypothetical protein
MATYGADWQEVDSPQPSPVAAAVGLCLHFRDELIVPSRGIDVLTTVQSNLLSRLAVQIEDDCVRALI